MIAQQPVQVTDSREMISMAEEELSRLQRQLRIMEDDRAAFSEETIGKLEKQRKIITILKAEKATLMNDKNVATCKNQKRQDKLFTKKIYKLLDEYEKCCTFVKNESQQIQEMNVQIKKLEHEIQNKRPKSIVTENYYQHRTSSGKKFIETLKNRLENTVKRFCAVLADNKTTRSEIDHLLKERNDNNIYWEKLLKEIYFGKKQMGELIEQATLAFDQREEWCSKLQALKKRARNDLINHTEDMRCLQRTLDHCENLREFLSVKGQKRILKDLEEKEKRKREQEARSEENQFQIYRDILHKIKNFYEVTEEDINKTATQFLREEEENFALFNYVNELSHEIEILNSFIDEVSGKIEEQINLSKEHSKKHKLTLIALQENLNKYKEQSESNLAELEKVKNSLILTLNGIEEIFDLLQCDRGPILYLLGNNSSINVFNVMIYLGSIEKRTSNLITEMYFAEKSMTLSTKKNKK